MDGDERRLDAGTSARCRQTHEALGQRGARVLAVASRRLPPQPAYSADDERELVLVGFIVFSDPLVPGVADALAALRRDGVTVKIVTGDSETTCSMTSRRSRFPRTASTPNSCGPRNAGGSTPSATSCS
jgi:Mg2+-importing ATPase